MRFTVEEKVNFIFLVAVVFAASFDVVAATDVFASYFTFDDSKDKEQFFNVISMPSGRGSCYFSIINACFTDHSLRVSWGTKW